NPRPEGAESFREFPEFLFPFQRLSAFWVATAPARNPSVSRTDPPGALPSRRHLIEHLANDAGLAPLTAKSDTQPIAASWSISHKPRPIVAQFHHIWVYNSSSDRTTGSQLCRALLNSHAR